jgi:plastocyanin
MFRLSFAAPAALFATAFLAGPSVAVDKWVTMYANEYRPASVTVNRGETVTFVSDDDVPHDAVGRGWSTPILNKGDSYALRFSAVGTYRYTCTIHPEMSGRIVVQAAGGSGATTPPTDLAAPAAPAASTNDAGSAIVVASLAASAAAFALVLRRIGRRALG